MSTTIIRSTALLLLVAFNAFFFFASGLHTGHAVTTATTSDNGRKVYVVFTERQPAPVAASETMTSESAVSARIESFHHGLLNSALEDDSSSAPERVVYHYTRSLHGFAARLTDQEKNNLAGKNGVISIHERVMYRPQTTRSWNYLGLPLREHRSLPFEQDVIIGMLDTGISLESESFSDDGLTAPPAKWKGRCYTSSSRKYCNNKIIGAWAYLRGLFDDEEPQPPDDYDGHGTHTASIAAGRVVGNASLSGLANGTARGAVPGARLAIYKVCSSQMCGSDDILAAMDAAIADGVDVISASLSGINAKEYDNDPLAIGAFHAMRRGVLTSVPAGNCGPILGTTTMSAPWIISTAAATTDRKIVSKIVLGNKKHFLGNSINTFPNTGKQSLLMDPGNCDDKLEGVRYKGAILLCQSKEAVGEHLVFVSGAAGVIFPSNDTASDSATFPAVMVKPAQFQEILDYYNSTMHPVATIFNSLAVLNSEAPLVADFSSRGPNAITPGILKPDLSAPGVEILAAWSSFSPLSMGQDEERRVPYNIVSGTSIASQHVTGAAAYVKSFHPDWSPAAIMSALVTTASPIHSNISEAELAYGAGLVNPVAAADPGLVYDAFEADYINLLCAQGYNSTQMATVTGTNNTTCPSPTDSSTSPLNHPSIAVPVVNYGVGFRVAIPRAVTNVGPADSVYRVKVSTVPGIAVRVEPRVLAFSAAQQKLDFTVSLAGFLQAPAADGGSIGTSLSIVWSDGKHSVRSPIYVFPQPSFKRSRCVCKPFCDLVDG